MVRLLGDQFCFACVTALAMDALMSGGVGAHLDAEEEQELRDALAEAQRERDKARETTQAYMDKVRRGKPLAGLSPGMSEGLPTPMVPPKPVRLVPSGRAQGFTGDMCPNCGSAEMVRSGSCATCQSCGETTGCS